MIEYKGFCGNCKHGELQSNGLSVKCSQILKDAIIFNKNDEALMDYEVSYVLLPSTFSCIDCLDKVTPT